MGYLTIREIKNRNFKRYFGSIGNVPLRPWDVNDPRQRRVSAKIGKCDKFNELTAIMQQRLRRGPWSHVQPLGG